MPAAGKVLTATRELSGHIRAQGEGRVQTQAQPGKNVSVADPLKPTAAELRRAVIYNKYRGIVDTTAAGGFGTLYGPNVTASGDSLTALSRD